MARLRGLGNALSEISTLLLRDRLADQSDEKQSQRVATRQRELAEFQRSQIAQQAELERIQQGQTQALGDPTGRVAQAWLGSGVPKMGELDLSQIAGAVAEAENRARMNKLAETREVGDIQNTQRLSLEEGLSPILTARAGESAFQTGLGTERAAAQNHPSVMGRRADELGQQNEFTFKRERGLTPILADRAGQTAGASARAQQQVENSNPIIASVAADVAANPERMEQLTPTMRAQVIAAIREAGGEVGSARDKSVTQTLVDAKAALKAMKESPGFEGAIGAKGPSSLFGMRENPLGGTAAASYVSYIDKLKANLTLPRLQFLRGLGHMSDREFASVAASVTALNRQMREVDFKKELAIIESGINNALIKAGVMTPDQILAEESAQIGSVGVSAREKWNARSAGR